MASTSVRLTTLFTFKKGFFNSLIQLSHISLFLPLSFSFSLSPSLFLPLSFSLSLSVPLSLSHSQTYLLLSLPYASLPPPPLPSPLLRLWLQPSQLLWLRHRHVRRTDSRSVMDLSISRSISSHTRTHTLTHFSFFSLMIWAVAIMESMIGAEMKNLAAAVSGSSHSRGYSFLFWN